MDSEAVPEVVVLRLPLYVRALTQLQREGIEVVSSQQLGNRLQMTPAQIRKDLSYFGRFGKQGRGYNIHFLLAELEHILGLTREWNACLIGVGQDDATGTVPFALFRDQEDAHGYLLMLRSIIQDKGVPMALYSAAPSSTIRVSRPKDLR